MSRVEYADPQAPAPSFGVPDAWEPRPSTPRAERAALASTVPLAISIFVFAIFILSYWLPETNRFPGRNWWLTQLSPLVSKYLTSAGEPLVEIQQAQVGITGALLLILGLLIFWMARSRYWMARMWIWAPVLAGAAVCVASTAVLAVRGDLGRTSLSLILMIIWVGTAAAAAWLSMLVDVEMLPPKSHRSGLFILTVFIVLGAPATAVGRLLFAPGVRQVAAELQNNIHLRSEALRLPENGLVYLSGALVGVVAWLAYQLLPLRRDRRSTVLAAALVGSLVVTLLLGTLVTSPAAERQVDRLRNDSPRERLKSACASWIIDPSLRVKQTVVIDGAGCRRVIRYTGYIQQDLNYLPESVSRTVQTPEGVQVTSKAVAARYENMLVVAITNQGGTASAVRGLRLTDGARVWKWSCPEQAELRLRFAGVPTGDNAERGYLTMAGEPRSVVVGCPQVLKHLDPRTGLGTP